MLGANGCLIPIKNIDALRRAIVWMIRHAAKLPAMGQSSRAFAERTFDVHAVNHTILHHSGLLRHPNQPARSPRSQTLNDTSHP